MLSFINSVTDKPEWSRKVHDEAIVAKWKAELAAMVAQAGPELVSKGGNILVNGFSDAMFDYCVRELCDKAALCDATAVDGKGGIAVVLDTAAAVFKADGRVPDDVRAALLEAIKPLEAQEPDWHPGSDGKVLDLVHPSLWPLVYGTSTQLQSEMGIAEAIPLIGAGHVVPEPTVSSLGLGKPGNWRMWSKKFQWLPCEVSFGADGAQPAQVTSYINNAHPVANAALYPVIGRLVDAALPMLQAAYDRVMSYPHENLFDPLLLEEAAEARKRIRCVDSQRKCSVPHICGDRCWGRNIPKEEIPEGVDQDDRMDMYEIEAEWFFRVHPVTQPEPKEYGSLPSVDFRSSGPWFPAAQRRPAGPLSAEEGAAQEAYLAERNKPIKERDAIIQAANERHYKALREYPALAAEAEKRGEARPPKPEREPQPPRVFLPPEEHPLPADKRLQVIVKLANIHLTPEKPRYDGGSWHFEGQGEFSRGLADRSQRAHCRHGAVLLRRGERDRVAPGVPHRVRRRGLQRGRVRLRAGRPPAVRDPVRHRPLGLRRGQGAGAGRRRDQGGAAARVPQRPAAPGAAVRAGRQDQAWPPQDRRPLPR
jgi:hypothetical protein